MLNINTKQNLYKLNSYKYDKTFIDVLNLYFIIKLLPDQLGLGNLSFLLYINADLIKDRSEVLLLCLDANNNIVLIYDSSIILNGFNRIVMLINSSTARGVCTVYVAAQSLDSKVYDVLYSRNTFINKNIVCNSPVRYYLTPSFKFTALLKQLPNYTILTGSFGITVLDYKYDLKNNVYTCITDMESLTFLTLNAAYYINTLKQLLKGCILKIVNKLIVQILQNGVKIDLKNLLNMYFDVYYLKINLILLKTKTNSILNILISKFRPLCGYVKLANIFYRKKALFGQSLYSLLSNLKVLQKLQLYEDKLTRKTISAFASGSTLQYWNITGSYSYNSVYFNNAIQLTNDCSVSTKDLYDVSLLPNQTYLLSYSYRMFDLTTDCTLKLLLNDQLIDIIKSSQILQYINKKILITPSLFRSYNDKYKIKIQSSGAGKFIISNISIKYLNHLILNDNTLVYSVNPPITFSSDKFDFKILLIDINNKKTYDYIYYNNVDLTPTKVDFEGISIGGWDVSLQALYKDKILFNSSKKGISLKNSYEKLSVFIGISGSIPAPKNVSPVTFYNTNFSLYDTSSKLPTNWLFSTSSFSTSSVAVKSLLLSNRSNNYKKGTYLLLYTISSSNLVVTKFNSDVISGGLLHNDKLSLQYNTLYSSTIQFLNNIDINIYGSRDNVLYTLLSTHRQLIDKVTYILDMQLKLRLHRTNFVSANISGSYDYFKILFLFTDYSTLSSDVKYYFSDFLFDIYSPVTQICLLGTLMYLSQNKYMQFNTNTGFLIKGFNTKLSLLLILKNTYLGKTFNSITKIMGDLYFDTATLPDKIAVDQFNLLGIDVNTGKVISISPSSGSGLVTSVNGESGDVVLTSTDILYVTGISILKQLKNLKYLLLLFNFIQGTGLQLYLIGRSISNCTFKWDYFTKTPVLTKVTVGVSTYNIPILNQQYIHSASALSTDTNFNFLVKDLLNHVNTSIATVKFVNRVYYGTSATTSSFDSAFILSLTNKVLSNTHRLLFATLSIDDKYIYVAMPSRLILSILPVILIDSTRGGVIYELPVLFTNSFGYTELYTIIRSTNKNIGKCYILIL